MDPNKPSQNTASQSKDPQSNSNVNTSPNPARFASFTLLKDESGFRIPNCDHIFEFDIYGGWFDEYKNYYNADGEPQTPPEYDDDNVAGFDDDEAERLAREYDMGDEDEEEEHLAHYDNIYLNTENKRVLQNYLKDQEINIEVRNVNFNVKEDEFERFLVNKRIEWIDLEFEYDNRNRFKGVVYITIDKPNAEKLIEFNGQRTFGREIKINVLRPDEEEDDAQAGGIIAGETQEKQGTNASWRAQPTDKAPETQGQGQPQTQPQKQGQSNPVPVSELEKNQSTQQQKSTGGFERNQTFNANQNQSNMNNNQRNQGYGNQQNQNYGKGQQQSGYQNYGQKGQYQQGAIQRNANFNSAQNQNQYQGNRQGSNYQGSRNQGYNPQYQMQGQGGYPYNAMPQQGSNAYMHPQQYSNYPQQWNQPYNQQSNGPFPGQFQPGHQGQNQNYQAPVNPGFEKNQIPPQNASAPKISGSQPQNQSGNSSAPVQETQKVSDSQPQKQSGNSSAPVQETQKVSDSQPQKQPENVSVTEVKTEVPQEDTAVGNAWAKKLPKKNKAAGK